MSLISLLDIISVVISDPEVSGRNVAVANRNGTNTILGNSVGTFFINCNTTFINGPRNIPRNPLDCIILDSYSTIL